MSADHGFTGPSPVARRAEALIRTLNGVLVARVIADEHDRIHEVHALVDDSDAPGQFARTIQSALLARFGALVELDRIFVNTTPAGLRNGKPRRDAGLAVGAPADAAAPASEGMPAIGTLEIERRRTHRVHCRLSIRWAGASFDGAAEVVDGPAARAEAAARATIDALNDSGRTPLLALEGIRIDEIAGRRYATVAVRAHLGRAVRYYAGAAAIEHSAEDAAAEATLNAAAPCFAAPRPGPRPSLAAAS